MNAPLVLLIIAIICWFLAAVPIPDAYRFGVGIGWLGLFFYGLSQLVK